MPYQKRNLEIKASELLGFSPVVILLGFRQCGKTTLARRLRPDWRYFDLERAKDFERVTGDFDFFLKEYSGAVIFDEAQRFPDLFKELRSAIDGDRRRKNRFLLIGSSSPDLISNCLIHNLLFKRVLLFLLLHSHADAIFFEGNKSLFV